MTSRVGRPRRAIEPGTEGLSRDQRRSRRKRPVGGKVIPPSWLPKSALGIASLMIEDMGVTRPATRGDCVDGPRPCPFVSCRYHLYLDVAGSGAIKINFPDLDIDEMAETCALDVADRGVAMFEEVAAKMNLTRERIRQLTTRGLRDLRRSAAARGCGDDESAGVRLPIFDQVAEEGFFPGPDDD